jgi:hypothetical protein
MLLFTINTLAGVSLDTTDWFLEEMANGNCMVASPDGGVINAQPEKTQMLYWNLPKTVSPGQIVRSSLAFTWVTNAPNSVVYKSILGDWRPTSPIAWVEDGVLQGAIRTVRHDFNFTAPSTPGDYRMRLAMTWAYEGITNFYGNGATGDAWHPGVGHWAEVEYEVIPEPLAGVVFVAMTPCLLSLIKRRHEGLL